MKRSAVRFMELNQKFIGIHLLSRLYVAYGNERFHGALRRMREAIFSYQHVIELADEKLNIDSMEALIIAERELKIDSYKVRIRHPDANTKLYIKSMISIGKTFVNKFGYYSFKIGRARKLMEKSFEELEEWINKPTPEQIKKELDTHTTIATDLINIIASYL